MSEAEPDPFAVVKADFESLAQSGKGEVFLETLGSYLGVGTITDATYAELLDSASFYLSAAGFAYLALIGQDRPHERQSSIAQLELSEAATKLLSDAVGRFAEALSLAWALWPPSRRADDWQRVYGEVLLYKSEVETSTAVRLRIVKRNLEMVTIEGSPRSITRLVNRILDALKLVDGAEEFDPEAITELNATAAALMARVEAESSMSANGDEGEHDDAKIDEVPTAPSTPDSD